MRLCFVGQWNYKLCSGWHFYIAWFDCKCFDFYFVAKAKGFYTQQALWHWKKPGVVDFSYLFIAFNVGEFYFLFFVYNIYILLIIVCVQHIFGPNIYGPDANLHCIHYCLGLYCLTSYKCNYYSITGFTLRDISFMFRWLSSANAKESQTERTYDSYSNAFRQRF